MLQLVMTYENFIKEKNLDPKLFNTAWAFCIGNPWENPEELENLSQQRYVEAADELAELVVSGIKTATAGDYASYAINNVPLPTVDDKFDIVLNSSGESICAIQTVKVYVTTFDKVTAEHAYKEGEGDRTLAYWRKVHEKFFKTFGEFSPNMEILCEEFKVISK
jgi:uncharacterized protein YhfF